MKLLILILMLFSLLGCKPRPQSLVKIDTFTNPIDAALFGVKKAPDSYYDPDLLILRDDFIVDAKERGVHPSEELIRRLKVIRWVEQFSSGKAEDAVMAVCSRFFVQQRSVAGAKDLRWSVIEVLRDKTLDYTQGSDILLRELVYHELFHCLFNKGHLPKTYHGIMNPYFAKGSKRAFKAWEPLLDDMFSPLFMTTIPTVKF